jgi:hypothetical protein
MNHFATTTTNRLPSPERIIGSSGFHLRLAVGVVLIVLSWSASWSGETALAHRSFFPLWLGYILTLDAVTCWRMGSSLWTRGRRQFASLFVVSIPMWWMFEAFNERLDNWSYRRPHESDWLQHHAESSIAFSTVVPAIFVTAEVFRSFGFPGQFGHWIAFRPGVRGWIGFAVSGAVMIALVIASPNRFFPLVWIGVFFLVDPLVRLRSGWNIATQVEQGWWGTVWRLFAAGITCGLFWEMWNWRAMPKWTYDIAYADWLRIFEMPMLGYGGYFPFALETYAIVMLFNSFFGVWPRDYLQFDEVEPRDVSNLNA